MRHNVPIANSGPIDVHLPLVCAQGGATGSIRGTATFQGSPMPLQRVVAWSIDDAAWVLGDPNYGDFLIYPALLATLIGFIGAQAQWLADNRDLEGDGLLWIAQPDESGLDASPKFDPVWGQRANGRIGFPLLVHRNRKLGFDARRIAAAGGPVVCEVITNVLWSLSLQALGRPSTTAALVERLWDEGRGLFIDEAGPAGGRPAVSTIASLAPLALPDLPEEIGRRLVEEHLLHPRRYWTEVPPPSVSAQEPSYEPDGGSRLVRRYWRGPTWINTAWLVWLGLRRLGYTEEAAAMTRALAGAAVAEGLREYYDPRSGAGLGARDFAWSTLLLEMSDPDRAVDTSYLATASK